jgi:hypothetical protein
VALSRTLPPPSRHRQRFVPFLLPTCLFPANSFFLPDREMASRSSPPTQGSGGRSDLRHRLQGGLRRFHVRSLFLPLYSHSLLTVPVTVALSTRTTPRLVFVVFTLTSWFNARLLTLRPERCFGLTFVPFPLPPSGERPDIYSSSTAREDVRH